MNDVALGIPQNLVLNMARVLDEFLNVHPAVAEGLFGFRARSVKALKQGHIIMRYAHAAPATTGHRLDHHGVADLLSHGASRILIFHHPIGSGRHGHIGPRSQLAAGLFVAKSIHHRRTRADERDVAALAHLSKASVLGKETVPGMDGINVGNLRCANDAVALEITFIAGTGPNTDRLISHLDMHGVGVGLRIDCDGANIQLAAGAHDTHGNLPTISYKNLFEHETGGGCG